MTGSRVFQIQTTAVSMQSCVARSGQDNQPHHEEPCHKLATVVAFSAGAGVPVPLQVSRSKIIVSNLGKVLVGPKAFPGRKLMSDLSLIMDERRRLCEVLVSFCYLPRLTLVGFFLENFIMYFNSTKYYFGTIGKY